MFGRGPVQLKRLHAVVVQLGISLSKCVSLTRRNSNYLHFLRHLNVFCRMDLDLANSDEYKLCFITACITRPGRVLVWFKFIIILHESDYMPG